MKYFNHKENKPRFTDRAVRSLVKLFNIDDSYYMQDMAKVEKLMTDLKTKEVQKKVEPKKLQQNKDGTYRVKGAVSKACKCCCHGHCKLSFHTVGGTLLGVSLDEKRSEVDAHFPEVYERDFFEFSEISEYDSEHIKSTVLLDQRDGFYDMLFALETNFNLEGAIDEDNSASTSTSLDLRAETLDICERRKLD